MNPFAELLRNLGPIRIAALVATGIAVLGFFLHVIERIKHEEGVFELLSGDGSNFVVIEEVHQRCNVVASLHCAQKFGRTLWC